MKFTSNNSTRVHGQSDGRHSTAVQDIIECVLSGELQIYTQPMALVSTRKEYHIKNGIVEEDSYEIRGFITPTGEGVMCGFVLSY